MHDAINKFWLIWNPQRDAPTRKHKTKESAKKESLRLARANPGETFIVMEAVDAYVAPVLGPRQIAVQKPMPDPWWAPIG